VAKLQDILAEESNPAIKLRVFVQGGGCSGMQYGFTLDEEQNEDDWDLEVSGVKILVDSMSGGYLQGAEIDYTEDTYGASFSIKNPQAVTTCGCGSSFSPD
jgi:iron-sulfur cluster insertion protein